MRFRHILQYISIIKSKGSIPHILPLYYSHLKLSFTDLSILAHIELPPFKFDSIPLKACSMKELLKIIYAAL